MRCQGARIIRFEEGFAIYSGVIARLHVIQLDYSPGMVEPHTGVRDHIDSFRKSAFGVVWSTPSPVRTTVAIWPSM